MLQMKEQHAARAARVQQACAVREHEARRQLGTEPRTLRSVEHDAGSEPQIERRAEPRRQNARQRLRLSPREAQLQGRKSFAILVPDGGEGLHGRAGAASVGVGRERRRGRGAQAEREAIRLAQNPGAQHEPRISERAAARAGG
jgi:hypothetical protein